MQNYKQYLTWENVKVFSCGLMTMGVLGVVTLMLGIIMGVV